MSSIIASYVVDKVLQGDCLAEPLQDNVKQGFDLLLLYCSTEPTLLTITVDSCRTKNILLALSWIKWSFGNLLVLL